MSELKSTAHRLVKRIRMTMESFDGPGSYTIGKSWKEKPTFEHSDLLQRVQRHLPECGFEVIHDIIQHKSIT